MFQRHPLSYDYTLDRYSWNGQTLLTPEEAQEVMKQLWTAMGDQMLAQHVREMLRIAAIDVNT